MKVIIFIAIIFGLVAENASLPTFGSGWYNYPSYHHGFGSYYGYPSYHHGFGGYGGFPWLYRNGGKKEKSAVTNKNGGARTHHHYNNYPAVMTANQLLHHGFPYQLVNPTTGQPLMKKNQNNARAPRPARKTTSRTHHHNYYNPYPFYQTHSALPYVPTFLTAQPAKKGSGVDSRTHHYYPNPYQFYQTHSAMPFYQYLAAQQPGLLENVNQKTWDLPTWTGIKEWLGYVEPQDPIEPMEPTVADDESTAGEGASYTHIEDPIVKEPLDTLEPLDGEETVDDAQVTANDDKEVPVEPVEQPVVDDQEPATDAQA